MIELIIDSRECKLKNFLPDIKTEQLKIGDIHFRNEEGEIVLIIERKTTADLAASICDGRHREQKARLLNSGTSKEHIMYVIEGGFKGKSVVFENLVGSVINTMFVDGIMVHRTKDVADTAEYLTIMLKKLNNPDPDREFWKYVTSQPISDVEYCATLKSEKKANMTPKVWFIKQLALIPGISEPVAEKITNVYPNVTELVKAYDTLPEEKRPKMLCNIDKIGNTISARVYEYFSR